VRPHLWGLGAIKRTMIILEQASRELNDPVFGCAAADIQKDQGKAQGISLLANGDGGRYAAVTHELKFQGLPLPALHQLSWP